jgi:hypothetical protein
MKTPRNKIVEALERFVENKNVPSGANVSERNEIIANNSDYNEALQDLRSQIPNLADEVLKIVVGEIENEIPNAWFPNSALHLKKRYMEDIITSLTQGTTRTKKEE